MFTSNIVGAPVRTRTGLRSHFLLDAGDVASADLCGELGRGEARPPNAVHSIKNVGEEPRVYVAVATPAIDMAGAYASGGAWDPNRNPPG